jgi:hypothetical protein
MSDVYQRNIVLKNRKKIGLSIFPKVDEIYDAKYVFVLSTGRCGTGLITTILEKSSLLNVFHNPKPELEHVSSLIHKFKPSIESLKLAIIAARFDFFVCALLRGKIFVETNNRITFFAPALADLFPNAKFIHLVRNPADFVRSGMRRNYYKEGNIQHQRLNPSNNESWAQMTQLEKIAWEWNEINLFIEQFKEICHPSRILTLKSEELFTQHDIIPLLFDFLDVTNPVRNPQRLLKKPVNKQTTGEFPKYKDWSDKDKYSLKTIATLASKYGYNL